MRVLRRWLGDRFARWRGGDANEDGDGRPSLGRRGERAAAAMLRGAGYRIVSHNRWGRFGEIDLIAIDPADQSLVVVEVKAARGENPPPEVHVNHAKQLKLTALAHQLARRRNLADRPIRFDVVGVVWPEDATEPTRVTHHPAAFEAKF